MENPFGGERTARVAGTTGSWAHHVLSRLDGRGAGVIPHACWLLCIGRCTWFCPSDRDRVLRCRCILLLACFRASPRRRRRPMHIDMRLEQASKQANKRLSSHLVFGNGVAETILVVPASHSASPYWSRPRSCLFAFFPFSFLVGLLLLSETRGPDIVRTWICCSTHVEGCDRRRGGARATPKSRPRWCRTAGPALLCSGLVYSATDAGSISHFS